MSHEVGGFCSRPTCNNYAGIVDDSCGHPNQGDAAHIKAEKPGQARYDENQNENERNSASNGIWLCPMCHRQIDRYEHSFTPELLYSWKEEAIKRIKQKGTGNQPIYIGFDWRTEVKTAIRFCENMKTTINKLSLLNFNKDFQNIAIVSDELRLEIVNQCRKSIANQWNNRSSDWCYEEGLQLRQQEIIRIFNVLDSQLPKGYDSTPCIVDLTTWQDNEGNIHFNDPAASTIALLVETYNDFINYTNSI
ncbi:HNH endonuclease [Halomonas sp. 5021]|uniref:HNH endonuclease n=1 Tax=Halomonas sp. 5021 TaxID=3082156 RepID=UPI002FCAD4A1